MVTNRPEFVTLLRLGLRTLNPWLVQKSTNFPKTLVVHSGIVFGYHTMTPNEVWTFMANGNTHALNRCTTTTLETTSP